MSVSSFGPFEVISLHSMDSSWFEALKAAYKYNYSQLNSDLKALDDEISSYRNSFNQVCVNPRPDKMWAWTKPVPFNQVKVVIVGQDPSNHLDGSGFAFHPLNPTRESESTRTIFDMMADYFPRSLRPLHQIPHGRLNFSLEGWLEQGVVLVNTMTTKPLRQHFNYCGEHRSWIPIMKQLFNHLYDTNPNVVFMLVGARARNAFYFGPGGLGEREEFHRMTRVVLAHHPANSDQMEDRNYVTFPEGLSQVRQLLQNRGISIDFFRLDMWRNLR